MRDSFVGALETASEREENRVQKPCVLVTGVTGYIGGRLVPNLLEAGYRVRVLVRGSVERLSGRPWYEAVEIVTGDILQPGEWESALDGVQVAYYLIHSMSGHDKFHQRDIDAATNFSHAAAAAGVERIIYLGGLGEPDSNLSEHLRSRQETGEALRSGGVPVTEFRASIVVGSGSLSFEMLRYLVERLPVMICPRWVYTRTQPIAIRDVLSYLVSAIHVSESADKIIEIGGENVLTYADMMRKYAETRDMRRWLLPVPVLTPRLSSHWVHWMTPIPARIARPLIDGLHNEVVVKSDLAQTLFPQIEPLSFETAVRLALRRLENGNIETIWSDAVASSRGDKQPLYLAQEQGMLLERRQVHVDAPPETVYRTFAGIGGERGWPAFDWMWRIRGLLDRMVGGVGMRRGRRHPDDLRVGDAFDFWRVEAIEKNHTLVLRAEMRLPGSGWLKFEANPEEDGEGTCLVQTAYFASKGLWGLLYWYSLYPIHGVIFSRMIHNLAAQAEQSDATSKPAQSPQALSSS